MQDVDAILDILADGREAIASLGIDQWQSDYPWRDMVESDIEREVSHVIELEGRILGTAVFDTAGEELYDSIDGSWLTESQSDNPNYVVIHRIAVHRSAKGLGFAKQLLDYASHLGKQHGCSSVRIDTHPGNIPMRTLIGQNGFSECGIIYLRPLYQETLERIAYEKLIG